jgi:hypothetical protein
MNYGIAMLTGLGLLLAQSATATQKPPLADWQSRTFLSGRDFWAAAASPEGRVVLGHRLALFIPYTGPVQATYFPVETGFRSVAHGNGRFVAVGYHGNVWSSPDGVNWTQRFLEHSAEGTNNLFSVTYGFDEFMTVGGYRALFYSADGMNWLPTYSLGVSTLFDIVKGPERVVTVGKLGQIISSYDGRNWKYHLSAEDGTFHNVAWGNDRYLATTWEGIGRVSPDGESWDRVTIPMGLRALTGNAAGFFGTDDQGGLHFSRDGVAWISYSLGFPNFVNRLTWTGHEMLAACQGSLLLASPNGFNWQALATHLPAWKQTAATAQHQLALGAAGLLAHSVDGGETWWPLQSHPGRFNSLTTRGNVFWATGPQGGLWSSEDATNWTQHPAPGLTNELLAIAFQGLNGVAVGVAGATARTTDGTTWQPGTAGTPATLRAVATDGARFVAVGTGVACTSTTGQVWSCGPLPDELDGHDLVTTRGIWVAVGAHGAIARSLDGENWQVVSSGGTNHLRQVITGNGMFLASDGGGLVLQSFEGRQWASQHLPAGAQAGAWHFAGRRFRALGSQNLQWESGDVRTPVLALTVDSHASLPRVRLMGEVGHSYRVQRAPDPAGPWTDWRTSTLPAPFWELADEAPAAGHRFFRALTP